MGPRWGIVLGIVVLVGNGWALFLSGGEMSSWGVVLEPIHLTLGFWHLQARAICAYLLLSITILEMALFTYKT